MSEVPLPGISAALERLRSSERVVAVELRPPRAGLAYTQTMDVWIDMFHVIQRLTRQGTIVFLTDNAVGQAEEENLAHLTANLGDEVDRRAIVPFLTCKHTMEYCRMYATRAASYGFDALTVLGGDQSVGAPRCVPHAHELRSIIRRIVPMLALGGWVNPQADARNQVDYLTRGDFDADFYLTQVVSHHDLRGVERFLDEARKRNVTLPGVFGTFLYRSANPKTLDMLGQFFPVPAEGITREFEGGTAPEEICARTIRALWDLGVTNVYVSNLGYRGADARYRKILNVLES
jgi:hypothetical protein